jgi:hypothetical protein
VYALADVLGEDKILMCGFRNGDYEKLRMQNETNLESVDHQELSLQPKGT